MGRVRKYELVMVLSPVLDETQATGAVDRVRRLITDRGGEVTNETSWGLRRLAYPIQRFNEGNYVLACFTIDGDHTHEIASSLNITEDVLRHLMIQIES